MLEMIKNNMRGGISMISNRYGKANNKYMRIYNQEDINKYIIYLDANNLYGWAMSQYLPIGEYEWIEVDDKTLNKIINSSDKSNYGYIIECDLNYPIELHDKHNDYPLAPESTNFDPSPYMKKMAEELDLLTGKVNKLIPNLNNKSKYVLHYRNLKLYTQLGLKVEKIHRVLKFRQAPILADYIQFNTEARAMTKLDYEKDLYKLFNNSIFGKTMENIDKRISVKITNNEEKFLKHTGKPYFKSSKIFSNDLVAINHSITEVCYDKPMIVGFSILELSKLHMYNFHYNVMKKKYDDNIKLLFTDTDSLCYEIKTADLYKDMKDIKEYFDFSEYPKNHECYNEENKKVIGKFKDETNSIPIKEFVGIKSKMYRFECDDGHEKGTAKGIGKNIAKKIGIDQYRNILFETDINKKKMSVKMNVLRNNNHVIVATTINKTGLTVYDDKRYYLNSVDSLSHGHYRAIDIYDN